MQKAKVYREIVTPDGKTQKVRFLDRGASLNEVKRAMAEEDTVLMDEEHALNMGVEYSSEDESEAAWPVDETS